MILPPNRHAESRPRQRRLLAMAATILFAFCVLIASSPHHHPEAWSRASHSGSKSAVSTVSIDSAVACALCDWLYAPTLPADAPPSPIAEAPVTRLILAPAVLGSHAIADRATHSASRGPPAARLA